MQACHRGGSTGRDLAIVRISSMTEKKTLDEHVEQLGAINGVVTA